MNRHGSPAIVGDYVTVGHAVRLHGCTIGSNCLIGIGAIVLDGVELEDDCLVAAGSLVAPGTKVPKGSLLMGAPAKVKRHVTRNDLALIQRSAQNYIELRSDYMASVGVRHGD